MKELFVDQHNFDIQTIQNLSENEMRDMGITQLGTRKKLLNEIEKLKRVKEKIVDDEKLLLTDVVIGTPIGEGRSRPSFVMI